MGELGIELRDITVYVTMPVFVCYAMCVDRIYTTRNTIGYYEDDGGGLVLERMPEHTQTKTQTYWGHKTHKCHVIDVVIYTQRA